MKSLFTFFLIITVFSVSAQDGVIVKYFDSTWSPTTKENARFVTEFVRNDNGYNCTSYYLPSHKLFGKSVFEDTMFKKNIGLMIRYYENGNTKDSSLNNKHEKRLFDYEYYENNNPKVFAFLVDSGRTAKRKAYYINGNIRDSSSKGREFYNYSFYQNGNYDSIKYFDNKDSNRIVFKRFDSTGTLISEKFERLYTSTQIEASFPGGPSAWKKYLEKNLQIDLPWRNGAPKGRYTVTLDFIVDKDGSISDIKTDRNPGFGINEEAIRVITDGPKWTPAIQNGHTVAYRVRQQITFVVN